MPRGNHAVKILMKIIDVPLALILLFWLIVWFFVCLIIRCFKPNPSFEPEERIRMIFTSGSHSVNSKRNIQDVYEGCLLDGYFKKVYFVYYLAEAFEQHNLGERLIALDFRSSKADQLKSCHLSLTANLLQEVLFLKYFRKFIQNNRITLLDCNDPYIQGINTFLLSKLTGIPYWVRLNCDYDHYYRHFGRLAFPVLKYRKLEKVLEFITFKFADGLVSNFGNYVRFALENGAPKDRTVVVTPVLDRRFF